jgi:glucose/arabinose dehydrogenase
MRFVTVSMALLLASSWPVPSKAADGPDESDYYTISTYAIPEGVVLEVGALEWLPGGRLAVSTRRGEIYIVDKPLADDPKDATFSRFAHGLHEVLGLAYKDGWLYAVQRCEITRLKDEDGDGRADLFETVGDSWEISGNYHEYAFGSKFDRNGDLWVALCLTGSFSSDALFRGWALRLTPDGRLLPSTSGLRSPGGLGMNAEGDMFYTENQGPWNGACALKCLKPGAFVGHPAGNKWYPKAGLGPRPEDPRNGSRMATEVKRIPELVPPAVYFPYAKMGQSASGIACDLSKGKFGPFENQMFVCDQSASTIMRVSLEKVNGRYQGVCFPFRQGFASGNLALLQTPDGRLIVGGTNRGWGSRGPKPFALERLDWTGEVPFEVKDMRVKPDGFELTFTGPVDVGTAIDSRSYGLKTYTYIYQASYGSPEVDETRPTILGMDLSGDRQTVRLRIDGLMEGHVHEFHLDGLRSAEGLPLLHPEAYYTLNVVPENEPD